MLAAISLRAMLARLTCSGFNVEAHWRQALGTATATRELAPHAGLDAGEAFLAGLLHDAGQLALGLFHLQLAARTLALSRDLDIEPRAAELQILGVGHDEVGAKLAQHWHLPASIVAAIAGHHAPPALEPGDRLSLAALVHVADVMAHALDLSQEPHEAVPALDAASWQALRLSDDSVLRVFARTEQGVGQLALAAA